MAGELSSIIPSVNPTVMIKWLLIGGISLIVCIAIGIYLYFWWNNKKYKEFHVVIFDKDSFGNPRESYDRAGIFLNKKTNLKLLFLKKLKKGLNPNGIPYTTSIGKDGKVIKTIYLVKTGVSNHRFCKVTIDNDILKFSVGEEDVNWAAQDYETITKTFGQTSFLEKYGGYILFIITIIIVMVILISLFGKFDILKDVAINLQATAESMEHVAQSLNQTVRMQTGAPIIVPGVGG
jgi:hypothetical protein